MLPSSLQIPSNQRRKHQTSRHQPPCSLSALAPVACTGTTCSVPGVTGNQGAGFRGFRGASRNSEPDPGRMKARISKMVALGHAISALKQCNYLTIINTQILIPSTTSITSITINTSITSTNSITIITVITMVASSRDVYKHLQGKASQATSSRPHLRK